MSLGQIANPYAPLVGLTGIGLTGGLLYIGLDGQDPETNPQQCYWDAAGTIPAAQPIDVVGGYPMRLGTPAQVFTAGTYSMRLRDRAGVQVFYLPSATGSAGSSSAAGYVSRAAAVAATIPTASQATGLTLLGYYAPGDHGGGFYKYATVQAAGGGKFQSADGAWWELTEIDIAPQMFGAKADASNDDTAAIQAAIDFAIAKQQAGLGARTVWLLGRYKITAPLKGFSYSGSTFTFVSFSLRGRARGYQTGKRTELLPTFKNAPTIILQKVRNVVIDDFAIQGLASANLPSYGELLNDASSPWWNVGGATDSAWSPACGIAIDPFGSGLPPDGGYPGLNGTGGPNYYTDSNGGSSGVTVGEGMFITGHIIAVGLSLSTNTQLGDNMKISGNLSNNKVCVAIGQSQNRGVWIERPFVLGCQVFIDCLRYGVGSAELPKITRGIVDYVKWLMLSNSSGIGPGGTIDDLFCESIWSLGFYGASGFPLKINGGQFKFILGSAGPTAAADAVFCTPGGGTVLVTGGSWTFYSNVARRPFIANSGNITFIGTVFDDIPAFADVTRVTMRECNLRYTGGTLGVSDRFRGSLSQVGPSNGVTALTPGGEVIDSAGSGRRRWQDAEGWQNWFLDNTTVTVTGAGTASFTAADAGIYKVGQYLQALTTISIWSGNPFGTTSFQNVVVGRVASIVGTTITLDEVPGCLTTGTYQLEVVTLGALRQRCVGTTTVGSNTITGATTGVFAAGNRIRGANIKEGSFVTAVSGATITISTNATASGAIALYDAVIRCRGFQSAGVGAPATGVWFQGDYLENYTPTTDANSMTLIGWLCVASGTPGTWKTVYSSAVSPAV